MPSHHDYGIDCETFCGGTPDDELPSPCVNCGKFEHSPAETEKCNRELAEAYLAQEQLGQMSPEDWAAYQAAMVAAQDPMPPDVWDNIPV